MRRKSWAKGRGHTNHLASSNPESETLDHLDTQKDSVAHNTSSEEQVERPGALTEAQANAIKRLYCIGLAVDEIDRITGVRPSTIHKHVKGVERDPPEPNENTSGVLPLSMASDQAIRGNAGGHSMPEIKGSLDRRFPKLDHEVTVNPHRAVEYSEDGSTGTQNSVSRNGTKVRCYVRIRRLC